MNNPNLTANKVLNYVIDQRKGQYVHAIVVYSPYELESAFEQLRDEFTNLGFTLPEQMEFFNTIEVYSLSEEEEDNVYDMYHALIIGMAQEIIEM